jgi:hypothetical protein
MARRAKDDPPRKRFSRAGHTTHLPATPPTYPPAQYGPPPQYPPAQYGPASQYPPPAVSQPAAGFGAPTYHQGASRAGDPDSRGVVGAARTAAVGTGQAARFVTRKVILASQADGARESGLTALIWSQVLSYGTDAMITVALASTVFFGASTHAQRGNVLLYLLVTMAPFAVVAPVIGPALDRLQHGRRWSMAGTAIGRAVLAIIMAGHPTDLVVLYPCALGSLVFSKAYSVIRAAAAPRLVPPGMTLVKANARLTMFGLAASLAGGGLVGIIVKGTGSYSAGLWVTAVAFGTCAYFAFRLPSQVDSAAPEPRQPGTPPRPRTRIRLRDPARMPPVARIRDWAGRGFVPAVIAALRAESALRFLAGFLTIFLAFHVEATRHGVGAAAALGAVVGAAGAGNFIGTALGARLKLARPEVVVMICLGIAGATCLLVAVLFSIDFAVLGMLISAAANALAKIALDALIQHDVSETMRSSAFARSETFLQLAWVVGAALGCLLPPHDGGVGFWVGGGITTAVTVTVALRLRAINRATSAREWPQAPGNLAPGPSQ